MKRILSLVIATAWLAAPGAQAKDAIDVMTQNQYLGADLNPIIGAPDAASFNQALITALEEIAANDFPTRAGLLADLISKRLPELVGLQEVYEFSCIDLAPPQPGEGCDDPSISNAFNDHLALTLAELLEDGESYYPAASVENLNIQLPVDLDFNGIPDIAVTTIDHDVILARADVPTTPVPYSAFCGRPSADLGPGCNYQVVAQANTALGPIEQLRGWVGVDATVDGKAYRFVDTHLEVKVPDPSILYSPFIQSAQAGELIAILEASTPPTHSLLVVGDINSSPEDPFLPGPWPLPPPFDQGIPRPYQMFAGAGYTDAWDLRPGSVPGYSCCQADDLSNHQDENDDRIDVILSLDVPNKVKKARVLGAKVSDKDDPFGLWPSDHGSVAGSLEFP
jgi:hypothetical protein